MANNPLKDSMFLPLTIGECIYLRGCLKFYIRSLKREGDERDFLCMVLRKLEDSMVDPDKFGINVF